jgi:UDP-N-acetylglucosamine transferase subunit ALG13
VSLIPSQSPIVFATVGTDQHPFDRLVRWLDRVAAGDAGLQCVIQYGTSAPPAFAAGIDYLNHDQLLGWVDRAAVVITHGGPASIVQVRERHGRPIVIPRDPRRGEHVDRHQLDFAAMLDRMDAVDIASSSDELADLVARHLETVPTPASALSGAPIGVGRFADEVNAMLSDRTPRRRRR